MDGGKRDDWLRDALHEAHGPNGWHWAGLVALVAVLASAAVMLTGLFLLARCAWRSLGGPAG